MSKELKYSQNFLKNGSFVKSLIDRTNIGSKDIVIEIGAGRGIITKQLTARVKKVIAIEYDPFLATKLKRSLSNIKNLEIVEADFMKWKLPTYEYKVFSNIPFNMTASIVSKLLESKYSPEATYLIMQDKAAQRFIGKPVSDNSQVSILLKPFYKMDIITEISRKEFSPIPKVNTVLAKFIRRNQPLVKYEHMQEYRNFVIYGYNQWEATILKAFDKVFSYKQIKNIKRNLRLEGMRPTELSVNQWLKLFEIYQKYVPENKKIQVNKSERELKTNQSKLQKVYRTRV